MLGQLRTDFSVAFMPAAVDACALYRMMIPHLNTPGSTYLFRYGPLDTRQFQHCKVAVVQRQVSEQNRVAMQKIKETGLKIVYDLDDNIWNLPSFNPGKKLFTEHQDGFLKCAEEADILTVSTKGLSTAARTGFKLFNKEILIIPNAIDFRLFAEKKLLKNDDTVLIGWGGSNTHSEDVIEAFSIVEEVLNENEKSHLELVGATSEVSHWEERITGSGIKQQRKITTAAPIARHPKTHFRKWVPVGEYPNRFAGWGWDIALAPLFDNRFNKSKSNIKMLEAAAIKIPCLVSDVQPYNEFCSLGGDDLKWLLCRRASDWKTKLTVLINEPERREFLGNKMYEIADKYFNANVIKNNWLHCFNKVLGYV